MFMQCKRQQYRCVFQVQRSPNVQTVKRIVGWFSVVNSLNHRYSTHPVESLAWSSLLSAYVQASSDVRSSRNTMLIKWYISAIYWNNWGSYSLTRRYQSQQRWDVVKAHLQLEKFWHSKYFFRQKLWWHCEPFISVTRTYTDNLVP